MEDRFTYQDFDLLIEPATRGRYRARVLQSPTGDGATVQFKLPFSPAEVDNLRMRVSRRPRGTRGRRGPPEMAPLKDFGGKLYDAVFQDELRDMLSRSLSRTRTERVGLRLRLRLNNVPALAGLPWEFLYDGRRNRFLARSRHTPLVRYLEMPDPPQPLTVEGPLRLLVMISNPRDWPELDVEQEWSVLTRALAQPLADGRVVIERMPANMSTLQQRLRHETFHVFHFVGHGYYRSDWGDGVLVMEDDDGGPHEVMGEELGGLLNEYDNTTRLAVLNACEGALGDDSDPFAGVAQSLIQQGLPAVVAMQFEITDDAAIIFAQWLYGAIADGLQLEAALAEARVAIHAKGNLTEWGTPVLYSRAPDGQLFDLTGRRRVPNVMWDQPTSEDTDQPTSEDPGRALADEIAAKDDPYDAADALIELPNSQIAHILALVDPDTAGHVLEKLLNDYDADPEILTSLGSDTLAKILDELGPWEPSARLLEFADARLGGATLSKMTWGSHVLKHVEAELAAAIIDAMTVGDLGRAYYFGGHTPDVLDRFIDDVSIQRTLDIMRRMDARRAARLLGSMTKRNPVRADELLGEMQRGVAGRIFSEMDIDIAGTWITRMDAAVATRLLETMPPPKAAILLKHIESSNVQDLLNRMRPERAFRVRRSMEKLEED